MAVYNNILAGAAGSGGAAGYQIDRSLRFTKGDSAHLYRQITTKGNTKTFTFACWFKKTRTGLIDHNFFSGSTGTNTGAYFCFPDNGANALGSADCLSFKSDPGAGGGSVETDAVFRDLSAWYHVVLAVDTTQATASNRVKIWVNGVSQSLSISSSPGYPNQNSELSINDVGHAAIGAEANGSSSSVRFHGDFYLADIHFIDGEALTASDFGEYDSNSVWQPKEFEGSYGPTPVNYHDNSQTDLPDGNVYLSTQPVENIFDGDDTTYARINRGTNSQSVATFKWEPTGGYSGVTKLRIKYNYSQQYRINGGTWNNVNNNGGYQEIYNGSSFTLNTLEIRRSDADGSDYGIFVYAIEINDTLVSNVGNNGFHLDFSDNSSNAALGTDSSGRSNTWTVNNISASTGGPTSVADASGALPIFNTTDTYGATKGTGTRTDSNSSSIVLAIPMDGSNGGTTFTDESATIKGSGSAKSITVSNVTTSTAQSKFYGSSAGAFSRSSAPYLSIADQADIEFGSGDFTIELWVYLTNSTSQYEGIFSKPGSSDQNGINFYKETNGTINFVATTGTGNNWAISFGLGSCSDFANKWVHFAISREGSNIRGFVNGVLTATSTAGGTIVNNGNPLYIGKYTQFPGSVTHGFDGYINDFRIYKGVAKYTSSFNPPSSTQDTTIAVTNDSLLDSPTNYNDGTNVGGNYCTWNPFENNGTLSNGNLDIVTPTSGTAKTLGTIAFPSSGKYYFEVTPTNNGDTGYVYIGDNTTQAANAVAYYADGRKRIDGTFSSYGASWDDNDVIGCAVNVDDGEVTFYKNGSSQGTISYTISGKTLFPAVSDGTSNSGTTFSANFGQRPFSISSVPTGFVSLCTTNLPDPAISDPSTAFDVALWTGNGSTAQTISTPNLSPDMVWFKERSNTSSHAIVDAVRGSTNAARVVYPDRTDSELTANATQSITSLNSDGFTIGSSDNSINQSNETYVGWAWDAGDNSSKTYTVKVVSDSGNKYRFDDFGTSAVTLDLEEGSTYVFDQSDSSNSGHPLRFSTTSDGTHNSGSEYTTGVTTTGTPGSAGAKTTIVVASGAATLYYYCTNHSGMGGQANTNSTAGASNFAGSIQSTVRANPSAGFSIVSYTGNSTAGATVGHGLGANVALYFVKNRTTTANWGVIGHALNDAYGGSQKYLKLHNTDAAGVASQGAGNSSTISLYDDASNNTNGDDFIAYCFSSVDQYSSFGSFGGNGSTDGPFVYTNMRPKFVLIKRTDSTASWRLFDTERSTYNVVSHVLQPNDSAAELTGADYIDILSTGFKLRTSNVNYNASGGTYLYAAFAENPFKTARAR